MMRERPIIFSAPMVRAILAGAKTQTRRVVKPQPDGPGPSHASCIGGCEWVFGNNSGHVIKCPYGQSGERLWVREAWLFRHGWLRGKGGSKYRAAEIGYAADNGTEWKPCSIEVYNDWISRDMTGNRSPIHMPRWASRITLEITGVKVERLNEISEEDAKAEGVTPLTAPKSNNPLSDTDSVMAALGLKPMPYTSGLATLWESIHGPGSWGVNPWVWVITFRKAGG